jgi:protein gp37
MEATVADHGTGIEWTQAPGFKGETWNPVTGCDRVSPGCAHCYALDLAVRLKGMGQPRYQRDGDPKTSGPGFGLTLHPDKLEQPLRWTKPRMVFVNSMSDLFHEEIPDEYIGQVFTTMAAAKQHVFQVLTKRPERMRDVLRRAQEEMNFGPLPNVWLGVSIENRRFAHRADLLRETPAAVRFVSAEPLLGPLVAPRCVRTLDPCDGWRGGQGCGFCQWGRHSETPQVKRQMLNLTEIDWLIVGGESGAKHRRVREQWITDLRDEAVRVGTAFFFKQWGGRTPKAGGRELDGRTWDEWPAALGVAA